MLLTTRNLQKSYGVITVLHNISLTINAADRIGIVGPNGVGKSTLLRLLVGLEEADNGTISFAPGVEFGYLPQSTPNFYGHTIQDLVFEAIGNLRQLEERMRQIEQDLATASEAHLPSLLEEYHTVSTQFQDRGGYEIDYQIDRIFTGLRIDCLEDMQKKVRQLSLGQRRKLEIARLLAQKPNILLLDEPTNYISLDVLEAFEKSILAFPGPVLAISHDRWFIQRFGGEVWELTGGHLVKQETANELEHIPPQL